MFDYIERFYNPKRRHSTWLYESDAVRTACEISLCYAKVYGALERWYRCADPSQGRAHQEPRTAQAIPIRRQARHLEVPTRTYLAPCKTIKHGRFSIRRRKIVPSVRSRAIVYRRGGSTRQSLSVSIILHYSAPPPSPAVEHRGSTALPAPSGAFRRLHGEVKTWHGFARAVRRGLANMKIQAYLTAAAINLKRLAAALLALILRWLPGTDSRSSDRTGVQPLMPGRAMISIDRCIERMRGATSSTTPWCISTGRLQSCAG